MRSAIHVFKVRLRVRKGDGIALDLPGGASVSGIAVPLVGARAHTWFPASANGTAPAFGLDDGYEYMWNATVTRP